ncbi:hypothetical protein B0H11DRAFT_2283082 [Mycena galericulata]|nr:hypothetical protein B0H11DRAFT_2283082 [Mycena galericulata]
MPIQQLFSLPTLRSVALECDFADPNDFLPIWTRCCQNLRNVVLDCYQGPQSALEPTLSNAITPIHLESLHIVAMNGIIPHWLQHGACPFDFSRLRVLAISKYTNMLRSERFRSAFQTIEAFSFAFTIDTPLFDLSVFPNLAFLHIDLIELDVHPFHITVPLNCLREVVLHGEFEERGCNKLDALLSPLLVNPFSIVQVQHRFFHANLDLPKYFPRLSARDIIHQGDYDPKWFNRHANIL